MAKSKYEVAGTEVFESDNYIIRVHHPKLSAQEHDRRIKQINDAAVALLMSIHI